MAILEKCKLMVLLVDDVSQIFSVVWIHFVLYGYTVDFQCCMVCAISTFFILRYILYITGLAKTDQVGCGGPHSYIFMLTDPSNN